MVADSDRPRVLTTTGSGDRHLAISRVLRRILVLNLLVASAEIIVGYAAGSIAIMSGGVHSLTDAASNVVALVGVSIARRPPDANHPYGHRKFETLAAFGIVAFLAVALLEILSGAAGRLFNGGELTMPLMAVGVVVSTMIVNIFVYRFEQREGHRLASDVLRADAMHTKADVLMSLTVLAALAGVWLGYPLLDPLAAVIIAVFIARAGWQIAHAASQTLSDEIVLPADDIRAVVVATPQVLGCEKIRTRGSPDHVFVDLHLWVNPDSTLADAHATSHEVKDRVMAAFPQIADAVIHIEPPHPRT
jgi:cation diffusion facilitator family transporter